MKLSRVFKGPSGILIGLGLAVAGPLLIAVARKGARPVARALLHRGFEIVEAAAGVVAGVAAVASAAGETIPDPEEVTVEEIRAWLAGTEDAAEVRALLDAERSGPARKTAIRALESRLSALTT